MTCKHVQDTKASIGAWGNMRDIRISTAVYSKIWANRQPGEETEDAILRRLLGCDEKERPVQSSPLPTGGVYAANAGVHFAEGTEIFRTYKGTLYRAKATGGRWLLLNNDQTYPSLHKLSWAVVQRHENSWNAWRYHREDGRAASINELRPVVGRML